MASPLCRVQTTTACTCLIHRRELKRQMLWHDHLVTRNHDAQSTHFHNHKGSGRKCACLVCIRRRLPLKKSPVPRVRTHISHHRGLFRSFNHTRMHTHIHTIRLGPVSPLFVSGEAANTHTPQHTPLSPHAPPALSCPAMPATIIPIIPIILIIPITSHHTHHTHQRPPPSSYPSYPSHSSYPSYPSSIIPIMPNHRVGSAGSVRPYQTRS